MKSIKKFILVSVVLAFIALVAAVIFQNTNDYVRITDMDYKAVIVDEEGSDGKVIITERLTFDVHAANYSNTMWELWRDLPEEYVDGVKVEYKVNSVKQILDDGTEIVYGESPKLYWWDMDYVGYDENTGPGKWFHSKGPYDGYYNFECVLFYVNGLYRETVVFEIEYEMYNASLRYNDSSEFYVSLFYGDDIKYLNSVKAQFLFPNDKMPSEGNYDAYTYGTNSHEFPFTTSTTTNPGYFTFSFELDKKDLKFRPYNQYVEFALISHGEDKHIFTEYAAVNHYYYDDMLDAINEAQLEYELLPIDAKKDKLNTLGISLLVSSLSLVLAYFANERIKRKYTIYKSELNIEYFRDIPSDLDPSFANILVFCKHKKKDDVGDGYAATMLSLARKGYIELEHITTTHGRDSNNYKIIVKKQAFTAPLPDEQQLIHLEPLSIIEERYLNLIVRHSKGETITHSHFQTLISNDYEYTNSFITSIKFAPSKIGVSEGYFQKAYYKEPRDSARTLSTVFIIFAVLVTIIGNVSSFYTRLDFAYSSFFIIGGSLIAGAIYLRMVSKNYFLLTQFGENEYAKWRGLYNFLNSETLMNERDVLDLVIWEKYLIYATAFGISEKVIKALQIRCPEAQLNNSSSRILRNYHFRTRSISRSSYSFKSSVRSASFTARSGGHGGYGGGGRGGGGGGGGH